jgi:hypothetical protein
MKRDLIYLLLIAALTVVVLMQRACNGGVITKPIVKVKIDTVYDVKTKEVPTYIPKYRTLPAEHDTVRIQGVVDTNTIINDHYTKLEYVDTIKLDSVGYVRVKDILYKNKIESRNVTYNYRVPIITKQITTIIPPNSKTQVYVGIGAQFNKANFIHSAGVNLMLKTKKDKMYGLSIGVLENMTPYVGGQLLWKIKIR